MKKTVKGTFTALLLLVMLFAAAIPAFAAGTEDAADIPTTGAVETETNENDLLSTKAWAAAVVVGGAAVAGALGMAWALTRSVDGIARQPEAEGKIRTTMMLGLVFIETAIIYALVVGILIIFVL